MKKKIKSEQNIIIIIDAIKKIMTIFLGPFLTAYFISTSTNSILNIAIYYIFTYATMALSTLVVAALAEKKNRIKLYLYFNNNIIKRKNNKLFTNHINTIWYISKLLLFSI